MSAPLTVAAATELRERAESEILATLKKLCADTGLDLEAVKVRTYATVPDLHPDSDDEPRVRPFAVQIILAV